MKPLPRQTLPMEDRPPLPRWLFAGAMVLFGLCSLVALRQLTHFYAAEDPRLERARTEDMYYSWLEGSRILKGENPYARILAGDMRNNQKFSTYVPGFYLICAGVERLGAAEFETFHRLSRRAAIPFQAATGLLLLAAFLRRRHVAAGLLAAVGLTFNRYNLYNIEVNHLENFVIPFYLCGFLLLGRAPKWAYAAFGVSLALKQVGVFLLPLYVLHAWHGSDPGSPQVRRGIAAARESLLFILPPTVLSLPFLVWNPEGFVRSMLFSATRLAAAHGGLRSVESVLRLDGLDARLPMLGLIAICYWCYARGRMSFAAASALVMAVFIGFNPVLFHQYMVWAIVPALVFVCESLPPAEGGDDTGKRRLTA